MINFEAAKDVLEFFKEKGAQETGNSLPHEVIVTDMIRDRGITLPWVEDGLTALADHMHFIVPVGEGKNEPDSWKLTIAGSRAMHRSRKCMNTDRNL